MKSILIMVGVVCCSFASAQILPTNLIKQEVHIDPRLVSNHDWVEFLSFLEKDPSFSKAYIQSVTPKDWSTSVAVKKPDKAVSGVSWKQANEYCKWRSEVNTYLYTHSSCTTYSKMLAENRLSKTRITYRLPTEDELSDRVGDEGNGVGFRCVYTIKRVG